MNQIFLIYPDSSIALNIEKDEKEKNKRMKDEE